MFTDSFLSQHTSKGKRSKVADSKSFGLCFAPGGCPSPGQGLQGQSEDPWTIQSRFNSKQLVCYCAHNSLSLTPTVPLHDPSGRQHTLAPSFLDFHQSIHLFVAPRSLALMAGQGTPPMRGTPATVSRTSYSSRDLHLVLISGLEAAGCMGG